LDRQRFGVACLFSAIPDDPSLPRTRPRPHRGQPTLGSQAPGQRAAPPSDTRRTANTTGGPVRSVRAGRWPSGRARASAVTSGSDEPQVTALPAHPAEMTQAGDSACDPRRSQTLAWRLGPAAGHSGADPCQPQDQSKNHHGGQRERGPITGGQLAAGDRLVELVAPHPQDGLPRGR
jgi:hypothetical protein